MKWNYRIGTQLIESPGYNIEGGDGANTPARVYYIIKCFYLTEDSTEEPFNFAKATITEGESIKEIHSQVKLMTDIFNREVYDMDNFPNHYKE